MSGNAVLCHHANEVPRQSCTCPADCPCRQTMCLPSGEQVAENITRSFSGAARPSPPRGEVDLKNSGLPEPQYHEHTTIPMLIDALGALRGRQRALREAQHELDKAEGEFKLRQAEMAWWTLKEAMVTQRMSRHHVHGKYLVSCRITETNLAAIPPEKPVKYDVSVQLIDSGVPEARRGH